MINPGRSAPDGPADPGAHLSVGEVARLAGVTTRTVRHYHSIGLIAEPVRDTAGYRRYGAREVVALVRIVRLRALGMPIPQIAARVGAGGPEPSLPTDLRALADELDREIAQLQDTRDRLRALADSETFEQPVRALTVALRGAGLLGPADQLAEGEESAATLLDALHPKGMSGVLTRASRLLRDPASNAQLMVALQRFRALDDTTPAEDVTTLAEDVVRVLPRRRSPARPGAVDLELMDKLLSGQLNPAQQRFTQLLRANLKRLEDAPDPARSDPTSS